MLFSEIPGLDDLKLQLIKGVEANHIAHAQLFLGREGTANLPMALAYATYLNCENRQPEDACGECSSCRKIAKFIHPDLHFSFPTAANDEVKGDNAKLSNNFLKHWRSFLTTDPFRSADEWVDHLGAGNRQLLISRDESREIIKSLSLKAFEGNYKIMLIWLPEYLHASAANALLKIIEEPSDKTIFLLVTNNKEKLLGTITSRTQSVFVPSYSDEEIQQILIDKFKVEPTKASQLAHISQGNLHKATSLIDDLADDTQKEFESWMRECYTADYTQLIKRSEQFHKWSKVNQQQWLIHAGNIIREALVASVQSDALLRISSEHLNFIKNFSKTIEIDKAAEMSALLSESAYYLERNASPKMTFMNVSIEFMKIFRS